MPIFAHDLTDEGSSWSLCKFNFPSGSLHNAVGIISGGHVYRILGQHHTLSDCLFAPVEELAKVELDETPIPVAGVQMVAPVDRQEIWGSGVTYRLNVNEDDPQLNVFQKTYFSERPFLFFKGTPDEVVGAGGAVSVRRDSVNSIAEPELAAFIGPDGSVVGYSVGSEVTCRDIEQQNLLYQPQAKAYSGGCAIGPFVKRCSFDQLKTSQIRTRILRGGVVYFEGKASLADMVRLPDELGSWLKKTRRLKQGAVILTGNNVDFPADITLQPGDFVEHEIDGIGLLATSVEEYC